jgi:hypothetical protein
MRTRTIGMSSIVIALLLIGSSAYGISSAVATEAVSSSQPSIISITYAVHVPPLPSVCCDDAYEFHLGLFSSNNASFVKTTISYACQIGEFKACFPPFKNRYIFYVSFIQTSSLERVQSPPNGYLLTPDSKYTITLSTSVCVRPLSQSIRLSISNATTTFNDNVCGAPIQQYTSIAAGLLEMHNVTQCSQLPSSGSFIQSNILVNNNPALRFNWRAVPTNPMINCGYALAFANNSVRISWKS